MRNSVLAVSTSEGLFFSFFNKGAAIKPVVENLNCIAEAEMKKKSEKLPQPDPVAEPAILIFIISVDI